MQKRHRAILRHLFLLTGFAFLYFFLQIGMIMGRCTHYGSFSEKIMNFGQCAHLGLNLGVSFGLTVIFGILTLWILWYTGDCALWHIDDD